MQVQLKSYDKDILQELWHIRNTIHSIRDTHKKVHLEESKFLDEMEDRSPTPESQLLSIKQLGKEQNMNNTLDSHSFSPFYSASNCSSPPSPQSPNYANSKGEMYSSGTLLLMAAAPQHLKKSSDKELLEEFFGSDHLDKMNIFKSPVSEDDQGVMPMPNISNTLSSFSYSNKSHHDQIHDRHPYKGSSAQTKPRIPMNLNSHGVNLKSSDIASEMEQLWERLHDKTVQELANFDISLSPKLHHAGIENVGSKNAPCNFHGYQGSLDSNILAKSTLTINSPSRLENKIRHGHSRQNSLPIDPMYYRQVQKELCNDSSPPSLYVHKAMSGNICRQHKAFGSAQQLSSDDRSHTPPVQHGHVRQVSGSSMSSAGSGTFSPPMVLGNILQAPDEIEISGQGTAFSASEPSTGEQQRALGQYHHSYIKPNKSLEQAQVSNISPPFHSSPALIQSFSSSLSPYDTRYSPEGQGRKNSDLSQTFGGSQLHYSSNAIRRKKNISEFTPDLHLHQQLQQQKGPARLTPKKLRSSSFEEKQWMGRRPPVYEKTHGGHGEMKSKTTPVHQVSPGHLRDRSSSDAQLSITSYSGRLPSTQGERLTSVALPPRIPKKKGGKPPITARKQTWI